MPSFTPQREYALERTEAASFLTQSAPQKRRLYCGQTCKQASSVWFEGGNRLMNGDADIKASWIQTF